VVSHQIGGENTWDNTKGAVKLDLLGAEGLREVVGRGVEIGSHTASHRALPTVSADQLEGELVGSADRIEAIGLPRPRSFSYPYGEWSPSLAAAVREAGYGSAFTVEWGTVKPGTDPFAIPRIEVHASDSPRKLKAKLALGGWHGLARDGLLTLAGVRLNPSAS
jgi:peptidoglycan/xylan/chitin deacetylase (PgdA/CDA1 family)